MPTQHGEQADVRVDAGVGSRHRLVVVAALAAIAVLGSVVAAAGRQVHRETSLWTLTRPTGLSIRGNVGDVTIGASAGAEARIETTTWWSGSTRPARTVVRGRRIALNGHCPAWGHLHLWAFNARCGVRYRLTLPASYPVSVAVGTGDLRVTGLRGALSLHAGVGDLTATGLRSSRARLTVGVGDVGVTFASAPRALVASSGTGDVTVVIPPGRYDVSASTRIGIVDIGDGIVDSSSSGRRIVVSAGIGDVRVVTRA